MVKDAENKELVQPSQEECNEILTYLEAKKKAELMGYHGQTKNVMKEIKTSQQQNKDVKVEDHKQAEKVKHYKEFCTKQSQDVKNNTLRM